MESSGIVSSPKSPKMDRSIVDEENREPRSLERSSPSFGNLPEVVLEKIFSYLNLTELARVSGMCRCFYRVSRRSLFWERLHIKSSLLKCRWGKAPKILHCLPCSVTHLHLNSEEPSWTFGKGELLIAEITRVLTERCPQLQVLVIENSVFRYTTKDIVALFLPFEHFPSLRVLCLKNTYYRFEELISDDKNGSLSKIEVLDLTNDVVGRCSRDKDTCSLLHKMKYLKELHLVNFYLKSEYIMELRNTLENLWLLDLRNLHIEEDERVSFFSILKQQCRSLVELYVCGSVLKDEDLVTEGCFPQLKIICLRNAKIGCRGLKHLLGSCSSLKHMYTNHSCDKTLRHKCSQISECVQQDDSMACCSHESRFDYMNNY